MCRSKLEFIKQAIHKDDSSMTVTSPTEGMKREVKTRTFSRSAKE
jgi:hypothetical protein